MRPPGEVPPDLAALREVLAARQAKEPPPVGRRKKDRIKVKVRKR